MSANLNLDLIRDEVVTQSSGCLITCDGQLARQRRQAGEPRCRIARENHAECHPDIPASMQRSEKIAIPVRTCVPME